MATKKSPASKRTKPGISLDDQAKQIEARVNANPALVKAIQEGREADVKKLVRAKDYFERRHGRASL